MARYFFHTRDGHYVIDDEGTELPNEQDARVEAARLMGALIKDQAREFWSDKSLNLMVIDEGGALLFALALSAVEGPKIRTTAL